MPHEKPSIDIDYVSNLARITLTEEEKQRFSEQLADVLEYINKLDTLDVSSVEATAHAFPLENVWREDKAEPGFPVEDVLRNAPEVRQNMIVVPKVVE